MSPSELEEMKKFNADKKAIVLDKSVAVRKGIESCLVRLGISSGNICSVSRFHDALTYVKEQSPKFVFTEFQIGDRFGLELIQELDRVGVSITERAFFMVTANSQDSAVAEAAEEDVDAYIVKPFSIDSLETQIVRVLGEKMKPSPYLVELQNARKCLEAKDPNSAIIPLRRALGLAKKTSLAYFYLGQCYEMLNDNAEALKYYREGLRQLPGHYKCSIGEFETLEKLGKQAEAYEVIKKVLTKYPLTPQRLGKVFILAIYTKHFTDVNLYYEIFLKIERRTDELVKIVTAGLYACGKYFCSINKFDEASGVFKKACLSSGRSSDYLKKVIDTLMHFKKGDLASEFLSMYSAEDQNTDAWKALDFQLTCLGGQTDRSIQKGRKLIAEGIKEVSVYIETAKLLIKQDKKSHAENVIFMGIERCPQKREELLKILN
jgi:tetratricopeptide (TPR) repeat protein